MKTSSDYVFGNLAALPTTPVYLQSFLKRAGESKHPLNRIAIQGDTASERIIRHLAIAQEEGNPFVECIIRAALTYAGLEYGSTILLDEIAKLSRSKAAFRPRNLSARFASLRFRFHIPLHLFDANDRALQIEDEQPLWKRVPEPLVKELEPSGVRTVISSLSFAGRGGFGHTITRAKRWMSVKGGILNEESVCSITGRKRTNLVLPTESLIKESVPAMLAFYYPVVQFLFAPFSTGDRQSLASFLLALRKIKNEAPCSWYKPNGKAVFVQGIARHWPTSGPTSVEKMLSWKIDEKCLREVHFKLGMLRSVFASWEEFLLLSFLMLDSCLEFKRENLGDDEWQQFSILLSRLAKQIEVTKLALGLQKLEPEEAAYAKLEALTKLLPKEG